MTQRKGGSRRKTRSKLRKNIRDRGKLTLNRYLQELRIGERVVLKAEPSIQKGIYPMRYHGLSGIIEKKKGNCYEVLIKNMRKKKSLIVHPVHLRKND